MQVLRASITSIAMTQYIPQFLLVYEGTFIMGISNKNNLSNVRLVSTSARPKVFNSVSDLVGNTPLVAISALHKQYQCQANIWAKLEYFNPMNSTKDRSAKAMIEALMAQASFNENTHVIEATSGNSGVSCAAICAIHQIPLTIVMPEHMSVERQKMIKHLGANLVTTPKALGMQGAIEHEAQLVKQIPHAISLNQFGNHANPLAHEHGSAQEIWQDTLGQVDVFIAGVGTGGSISGVGRGLKKHNLNIEVVAVEPASCPVLSQGKSGPHGLQGLSSGHVPKILDQSIIDQVETVSDADAIAMAKALAMYEGMPVGISSGATMVAAIRLAQQTEYKDKNIVVILADTAERYYSTDLFSD